MSAMWRSQPISLLGNFGRKRAGVSSGQLWMQPFVWTSKEAKWRETLNGTRCRSICSSLTTWFFRVSQGHGYRRMPGFLASSNSKILSIPGGQQDIDLGLALYFGGFVQSGGARRNLPYAYRIYNTVRISYTCWALYQMLLHTPHLVWFPQLFCVTVSCPHLQRRKQMRRPQLHSCPISGTAKL